MSNARNCETPMEQNLRLTTKEYDDSACREKTIDPLLKNPGAYRRLIGRLIYLTVTKPDICFVVQTMSQFIHDPNKSHMEATVRVLRYLKATTGPGIIVASQSDLLLTTYCDSVWGTCPMTRRSVTGYCIKLENSLI